MGFEELKRNQSAMWGVGPYERVEETLGPVHDVVLARLAPRRGERLLDIAAGTGQLARRAARLGTEVTAVDLAPRLVERGRELAETEGLSIRFDIGDAESLSYENASFDVVVSTIGAMFAPDHRAVASELARVCRPGARLGLVNWLPGGGVAEFFRLLAGFRPPDLPGAGNPLDWGREQYVSELLGEMFELSFEEGNVPHAARSGKEMWELFSTSFGPTKTLADSLDAGQREELHRALVDYWESYRTDGGISWPRQYLLIAGTRC